MAGIILVIIGLILSTVDIPSVILANYPKYEILYEVEGLGEVIQQYVAYNLVGDKLRLDIFPDLLGYVFILAGVCVLVKYNLKFLKVIVPLIATAGLCVFMKQIPFMYEGKDFIVNSLVVSVFALVIEIFMEYRLIYTIADTTADLPNQRDTVLMKFGWIGSVLCRGFIYCIVLVGLADWIIVAYRIAQFGFMVFCIDRMFRCRHYLKKNEGKGE